MEEAKKGLLLLGALAQILILIGCKSPSQGQRIFEPPQSGCIKKVVPNEFLVQWKNGDITLEYGKSKEQFEREFVEEHLHEIQIVEENQLVHIPKDFHKQKSLETPLNIQALKKNWGVENIQAQSAWDQGILGSYLDPQTQTQKPIVVAVLDDGIDLFHKKLRHQIYYNPGEMGLDEQGLDKRTNGIDDDGNGYVDDFAGYNFAEDSPIVRDSSSHGTHVSGIIVAQHDDLSSGVKGVAPEAKVLPLDFMSNGGGSIQAAVEAIDYAIMRGAHIINASWGGSQCSAILEEKINSLEAQNILFVAAAGNESMNIDLQFIYPASFDAPALMVVGSIQEDLLMARHSNYGQDHVDLFAPGKNIVSTITDPRFGEKVAPMTGTSMATPFVSGAAALLMSASPQAPISEIKGALLKGASHSEFYKNASQGRLNVDLALKQLLHTP